MVTWSPARSDSFAPAAAKQSVGGAGFDGPAVHFAVWLGDIHIDPRVRIHEVKLHYCAVESHRLFVIELSREGVISKGRKRRDE
jgi:hypothetical protein